MELHQLFDDVGAQIAPIHDPAADPTPPKENPPRSSKTCSSPHPASIFDLQDLIYPQQVPDIHKTELIQRWLNQLPRQYDFCRAALEPPLNELAADIGHLAWRIPQEIDDIQATNPIPAATRNRAPRSIELD